MKYSSRCRRLRCRNGVFDIIQGTTDFTALLHFTLEKKNNPFNNQETSGGRVEERVQPKTNNADKHRMLPSTFGSVLQLLIQNSEQIQTKHWDVFFFS